MRTLHAFALSLPLAFVGAPAFAQESGTAITAISSGDYGSAEATLLQELRIHPGRPELLLNLAAVYAHTGRAADARVLYQQVLAQNDVMMDLPSERIAGSHAIARVGLRKLEAPRIAATN